MGYGREDFLINKSYGAVEPRRTTKEEETKFNQGNSPDILKKRRGATIAINYYLKPLIKSRGITNKAQRNWLSN